MQLFTGLQRTSTLTSSDNDPCVYAQSSTLIRDEAGTAAAQNILSPQ